MIYRVGAGVDLKPSNRHVATPIVGRSSSPSPALVHSHVKSVSMHIPTPIPIHGLSFLSASSSSNRLSTSVIEQSPRRTSLSAEDARSLYPESALHTPTKRRRKSVGCVICCISSIFTWFIALYVRVVLEITPYQMNEKQMILTVTSSGLTKCMWWTHHYLLLNE